MKANEAPEKLWWSEGAVWHTNPNSIRYVEYTRNDAFVEKAYSWLKSHYRDYMYNPTGKRLEAFFGGDMCNDFVDYMKGE